LVIWLATLAPSNFVHLIMTLSRHSDGANLVDDGTSALFPEWKPDVVPTTAVESERVNPEPKVAEAITAEVFVAAVRDGDEQRVERLLKNGADVNSADMSGHTALFAAAQKGSLSLVK